MSNLVYRDEYGILKFRSFLAGRKVQLVRKLSWVPQVEPSIHLIDKSCSILSNIPPWWIRDAQRASFDVKVSFGEQEDEFTLSFSKAKVDFARIEKSIDENIICVYRDLKEQLDLISGDVVAIFAIGGDSEILPMFYKVHTKGVRDFTHLGKNPPEETKGFRVFYNDKYQDVI